MVSFRADDADVIAADHWAQRLGVDRSELLQDALRRHLAELAADHYVAACAEQPLSPEETSLTSSDVLAAFATWLALLRTVTADVDAGLRRVGVAGLRRCGFGCRPRCRRRGRQPGGVNEFYDATMCLGFDTSPVMTGPGNCA
jgi:hypothetical protein